jgi:hypothetical protein
MMAGLSFPLTLTTCGESGASSAMVSKAVPTPDARGVKVTVIVQLELTAMAELREGLEEL